MPEELRALPRWRVVSGHWYQQRDAASRAFAQSAGESLWSAPEAFYDGSRSWPDHGVEAGAWFDLRESDGLQVIRVAFGFACLTRMADCLGTYAEVDHDHVNVWVRHRDELQVPPNPWWITCKRAGLVRLTGRRIEGCQGGIKLLPDYAARVLAGKLIAD